MKRNGLFMVIVLVAISFTACKKEKEKPEQVLRVRMDYGYFHDGNINNFYQTGIIEDLPKEITVKKGTLIDFKFDITAPKNDDGENIPLKKQINLKIVTSEGLTLQRDVYVEEIESFENSNGMTVQFPAETSFTAYFTVYGMDGKSYENDVPLKVNTTTSNGVIEAENLGGPLHGRHVLLKNAYNTDCSSGNFGRYFLAPYYSTGYCKDIIITVYWDAMQ